MSEPRHTSVERIIWKIFAGLVSVSIIPLVANAQLEPNSCAYYQGNISKTTVIGMTLHTDGHTFGGAYFYKKSLRDIPIKGVYTSERAIRLTAYDPSGNPRGVFSLRFVRHDPQGPPGTLTEEVLRGKWVSSDGQSHSVFLDERYGCSAKGLNEQYAIAGVRNGALAEKNAQGFYFAVLNGDRQKVVKYIHFPFIFNYRGHRKVVSNRKELLRYYDSIFTKEFVAKVAKGIPHDMFANWQGIMLGNGDVWFWPDGKAWTLNN